MTKMLTVKEIEALVPGPRVYHVKVGALPGLWLRVATSGRRSFLLTYTAWSGVSRTLTLGQFPVVGPVQAEKLAIAALAARDQGRDPQLEKTERRRQARQDQAESVSVVIAQYIESCKRSGQRSWKPKESTLRRHVESRWATRPIRSITRRDVVQLVDEVDAEHGPLVARDTFSKVSALLSWADSKSLLDRLPTTNVALPGQRSSRDRVLTDQELFLVWEATGRLQYPVREFLRLLALTGQRRNQIAGLTRSEVSIGERTISWSGARMKSGTPHSIPLCDEAMRVILSLPVQAQHLFSFDGGAHSIQAHGQFKSQLDAAILAIAKERGIEPPKPWVFHDLRRTAASRMADTGVPRDSVELLLAHKLGDAVSQAYDRSTHYGQKSEALRKWEGYLMQVVEKHQQAA